MPKHKGGFIPMETLSVEQRLAEPDRCQLVWYNFAASFCKGLSVLDVGTGTGYGLDILQHAGAGPVCGIDPLPLKDYILNVPIEKVTAKSYDVVLALDVIEHVEADKSFFKHLVRVAKQKVFFSTPNWNHSKAENQYHCREYTPAELVALLGKRKCTYYTLDEAGGVQAVDSPDEAWTTFGVLVDVSK